MLDKTDNIKKAEEAMGFPADTTINLLDTEKTPAGPNTKSEYQRHVAIEWEGGVLWLNMFDFGNGENPHYCIDVRQFNNAGKVKGQGVFAMSRGYRGSIATVTGDDAKMVKGHNWNGGYMVALLTDPDGKETHTEDERA